MIQINFYKYQGEPSTINKQLGTPKKINGVLFKPFDLQNPSLKIRSSNLFAYNYCQIEALGRYYFVDNIDIAGNGVYNLSLSVDVLKTYEYEILNAKGTLIETENPDTYSSNRETIYNLKPQFERLNLPNKELLDENGTIIMITLKGNK